MVREANAAARAKWPHALANTTRALKKVLAEVWPDAGSRPKLVGPMMGLRNSAGTRTLVCRRWLSSD